MPRHRLVTRLWSVLGAPALQWAEQRITPSLLDETRRTLSSIGIVALDVRNRRDVYRHIADYLSIKLERPLLACMAVTLDLCHETEPLIVGKYPIADPLLLHETSLLVIHIEVTYSQPGRTAWERQLTIYCRGSSAGGQLPAAEERVLRNTVTDRLSRRDIPDEIARECLKTSQRSISFLLYPTTTETP